MTSVGAVLVAAGSGSRLGAAVPKAFVELGGRTLLEHAVERLLAGGVARVVAVVPAGHAEQAARLVGGAAAVVAGGDERQDSVAAGLAALATLADDVDVVLVHDAARCLAPPSLVRAVAAAVAHGHPAVVPGLPVVDTIKQVDDGGLVVGTPARSALRAVQTPQAFDRRVLERAHAAPAPVGPGSATDDAALVERLGVPVLVVDGHPEAFKITVPADLELAQRVLARRGGS